MRIQVMDVDDATLRIDTFYGFYLEDMGEERRKPGAWSSVALPGTMFCVLKVCGRHVVWMRFHDLGTPALNKKRMRVWQDMLNAAGPLEFGA